MGRSGDSDFVEPVTISREGERYVARDPETGVARRGESRTEALMELVDALRLRDEPSPGDGGGDLPDDSRSDG